MTSIQPIKIQQCLHGYESGHKLLSSSKVFPQKTQAQLLKMSDASINGYSETSPTYLTGFPLKEVGAYALARTWPAPEMSRPGCVWTHTIIIDYADLALILDAEILLELFVKPLGESDSKYKKEIIYNNSTLSRSVCNENNNLRQLMNEIYVYPNKNVTFPFVEHIEKLILKLWSQQWPKLRRNFSFRTLASSKPNAVSDFDLNILNTNYDFSSEFVSPDWLILAEKDILQYPNSELRKFLWRYGASCNQHREAFIHLVYIFNYLYEKNKLEGSKKALEYCADWSNCSSTIFLHALNVVVKNHQESMDINLWSLIFLVLGKIENEEEGKIIFVDKLSKFIVHKDIHEIREILRQDSTNSPIIIEKIIRITALNNIGQLLPINGFDINNAFKVRRDVCATSSYWEHNDDICPEIIEAIEFEEIALPEIVKSIYVANNYNAASELVNKFGRKALVLLLKNIIDSNSQSLDEWRNILFSNKTLLLKALFELEYIPINLLSAISKIFDPSEELYENSVDIWVQLVTKSKVRLLDKNLDFAIFLFERAFSGASTNIVKLISYSLEVIADAICEQRLNYDQWRRLERVLPKASWLDWDKCEILLKGVCTFLKKNNIDIGDVDLNINSSRIANRLNIIYYYSDDKKNKIKNRN
jgi:hypothetical protein